MIKCVFTLVPCFMLASLSAVSQSAPEAAKSVATSSRPGLSPIPPALGVPAPGPTNDAPYAPQPILPGGVVIALYPPGSPLLKAERVREAEVYNLSKAVPGRIGSIVNIHNPSVQMHLYGNGRHPGDPLPDGSRMSGGLTDRGGIPFGTWQERFIDWFRDLGFLQKPGVETKAAQDIATFASQPASR